LLRDACVDTINILDFNRIATARFLIELDCFYAPDIFHRRSMRYETIAEDQNNGETEIKWKPEDVVIDAIFSQILCLPAPEHKLTYYHSLIAELCKAAPGAIAPSLGRAIRFIYTNIDMMDMELCDRFMDWFAHHMSNFDFRWKWIEW
jgi:nuclear cap-binding protein subunit 1